MSLEHPYYYDRADRVLYEELFYRKSPDRVLTPLEKNFVTSMYHQEEYDAGLDGIDDYEEED